MVLPSVIKLMTSLKLQTEAQVQKTRESNPKFMEAIEGLMESAHRLKVGGEAIGVGQEAPDFELPNAQGDAVSLSGLLAEGPVVVSFYRGSWCPYCNLELRALQGRLSDIHALGAKLIAISPQMPDDSLTSAEKGSLKFPVLSDQGARVAEQYGVAWKVPALILDHMRTDRGLDLEELNDGNGNVLPIPANFVLDRDGIVAWRFVDVDYRKRAESDEIVAALQKLASNQ